MGVLQLAAGVPAADEGMHLGPFMRNRNRAQF